MTIWKFPLKIERIQEIEIQLGSEFLCIQVQDDIPTAWFKINEYGLMTTVPIYMYPTGLSGTVGRNIYMGTAQVDGFVWHYFRGD